MRISSTMLKYLGLAVAVAAIVLSLASLEQSAHASSRMHPESAIALAIAAYVFVRASESAPK